MLERKYSVWIGRSIRIGSAERGVNEAAQEITFRSSTSDVEGTEEHILSLSTAPPRFDIHRRKVSSDAAADAASAGRSKPERSVRLAEADQGLSRGNGEECKQIHS